MRFVNSPLSSSISTASPSSSPSSAQRSRSRSGCVRRVDADREAVGRLVRQLRNTRREIATLATDTRERERQLGQLQFEFDEITAAGLAPGEDSALRDEQSRLANAGRLLEAAAEALEALESSSIGQAARAVASIASRDPGAGALDDAAVALESSAADLVREVRRYRDSVEEDPARLAAVNERLERIARLCRKYGDSVSDVIAYGEECAARIEAMGGAAASIEALREREAALLASLGKQASTLSRARRAAAGDLVRAIASELDHLGMGDATLSVGFACDEITPARWHPCPTTRLSSRRARSPAKLRPIPAHSRNLASTVWNSSPPSMPANPRDRSVLSPVAVKHPGSSSRLLPCSVTPPNPAPSSSTKSMRA